MIVLVSWDYIRRRIKQDFPGVPSITTNTLADWLNDPSQINPMLVDVRQPEEYHVSHLHRALNLTDASSLLHAAQQRRMDQPSLPLVVYCSVGYRSARLVRSLVQQGMDRVFNLDGSIFQWFNEGRTVFRGTEIVDDVHPYNWLWGKLISRPIR